MTGEEAASVSETVVVTGASAGVGRAVALAFGREGASVGLLARHEAALQEVVEEIEAAGGRAIAVVTDVADAEQVEEAAERVERAFGPITVWVNNAMATVFSPLADMNAREFERATDVTYLGVVYGTMSALRRMRPREAGMVVQVGSALAYRSIPLQSAYCGAKHAIRGFTDAVRCELLHDESNVGISSVHLPAINTPQFQWARARIGHHPRPLDPIYDPEVAADAVLWAARHRWREVIVGNSTLMTVTGNKVAPGLLDHYLAHAAYEGQHGHQRLESERSGNLFEPVAGYHAVRGPFDADSKQWSLPFWATTYPATVLGGGLLLAGIAGAIADHLRRPKRRRRKRRRRELF